MPASALARRASSAVIWRSFASSAASRLAAGVSASLRQPRDPDDARLLVLGALQERDPLEQVV